MNKVLILGGKGMLGQMVKRVLSREKNHMIKSTHYKKLPGYLHFEIGKNKINSLEEIIQQNKSFDYIINCVGILNSRINENDQESVQSAIKVNALFPHELAKLTNKLGIRVIQISTDGVFSINGRLCMEDSPRNCHDVYGWTKALGEVISPNFLNLRCSIIGPSPNSQKGLLEWFLSQPKKSIINGFTLQRWTGITTLQFANLSKLLINDNYFDVVREESPIHHFCPNKTLSKYKLLKLLKENFRRDILVRPSANPAYRVSRILKTKFTSIDNLFGYDNSMQKAIKELVLEIEN